MNQHTNGGTTPSAATDAEPASQPVVGWEAVRFWLVISLPALGGCGLLAFLLWWFKP